MPIHFLHAKQGEEFLDKDGNKYSVVRPPIKDGATCKCKTFCNAVQAGYESQVDAYRGKLNHEKDTPEFMKVFASGTPIFPPDEKPPELIVAGPVTGKTTYANSSVFNVEIENTKYKRNWPDSIISQIKRQIDGVSKLIVGVDKELLEALKKNNIEYTLVYPQAARKEEIVGVYKDKRQIPQANKLEREWGDIIKLCYNDPCKRKIELPPQQFLSEEVLNA